MTPERRAELKQQCGSEPNLRATLATLEADLVPKLADVDALLHKKATLIAALAEIAGFKAELALPAPEVVAESAAEELTADDAEPHAKKSRKHK